MSSETVIGKHTPGPWAIEDKGKRGSWIGNVDGAYPRWAALVLGETDEETKANARLIAAAPQLLEALQFVLSAHGEQLHDAFDDSRKAIAAATGDA